MIQRSMAVSRSTIGALPLTSRKNVEAAFGSGTGTLFQGGLNSSEDLTVGSGFSTILRI